MKKGETMNQLKNFIISYSYQYQADDLALVLLCCIVALVTGEISVACDIGIMYCLTKIYGVPDLQSQL